MKLKMRLLAPLFAVLMLGTATSAFADLLCEVRVTQTGTTAGTPVLNVVNNGHWEQAADLLFNCIPGGTLPAQATQDASVTIYYSGLTISNTPTAPAANHNISVAYGGTGTDYGVFLDTTRTDTGPSGVSQAGSLIALTIPAQPANPTAGSFVLRNVILSIAGGPTAGPIGVNVNIITQNGSVSVSPVTPMPVNVITNVRPLLNNSVAPPALTAVIAGETAGPAQFTTAGTNPPASINCSTTACRDNRAAFSLVLTEDHVDSFRAPATNYLGIGNNGLGTGTINGTNVLYTFSGMLPGSVVTNCVLTPTGAGQVWTLTGSGIAGTNGQTTLVAEALTVPAATMAAGTVLDALVLRCGTSQGNPAYGVGTSTGPATTNITATMTPFPTGAALPAIGGPTAGGTPRYAATGGAVGPITVITFGAAAVGQTMMIIPYAIANVGTYDTGIALANTTKDGVFGTDAQGAAPDTSGNLTFNFYPSDGSASFSITPTTGFNLVSGALPSGNTFIGTLSSIMRAGNQTGAFQGYIIVQANFTHAHATAYIYGGGASDRLTSATDVLVISNPLGVATGRGAFATTVGSVEQTEK